MNAGGLSPVADRKQQVLAVLLALTALLSCYVLLLEPLIARYQGLHEAREAALLQEQKYRALIARRPELEARVAALDAADSDTAVLFSGETASIAGAALATRIRTIIEAAGGEIRSSRTRQPTEELELTRVEVNLLAQIPFAALTGVLTEIELGKPSIFLDEVSIRSAQNPRSSQASDMVDLQVNAQGYTDLKPQRKSPTPQPEKT